MNEQELIEALEEDLIGIHEEVGDSVVRYLKGERPRSIINKL